jgi:hypothetical protein
MLVDLTEMWVLHELLVCGSIQRIDSNALVSFNIFYESL